MVGPLLLVSTVLIKPRKNLCRVHRSTPWPSLHCFSLELQEREVAARMATTTTALQVRVDRNARVKRGEERGGKEEEKKRCCWRGGGPLSSSLAPTRHTHTHTHTHRFRRIPPFSPRWLPLSIREKSNGKRSSPGRPSMVLKKHIFKKKNETSQLHARVLLSSRIEASSLGLLMTVG